MACIHLPLKGNKTLLLHSNWYSDSHCNFQTGIVTDNKPYSPYSADSLDKHLTKPQIETLELLLAAQIKIMLEGGK